MARLFGRTLLALAVTAGALAVSNGPAQADTGCVVSPAFGDSTPVYAATTTSSAQVGTITYGSLGRGCTRTGGSAYQVCGGGSGWD